MTIYATGDLYTPQSNAYLILAITIGAHLGYLLYALARDILRGRRATATAAAAEQASLAAQAEQDRLDADLAAALTRARLAGAAERRRLDAEADAEWDAILGRAPRDLTQLVRMDA